MERRYKDKTQRNKLIYNYLLYFFRKLKKLPYLEEVFSQILQRLKFQLKFGLLVGIFLSLEKYELIGYIGRYMYDVCQ